MCFCKNYQDIFIWIGAIIINFACITIVTTSTGKNSWVGAILSGLYAVCLYRFAQHLVYQNEKDTSQIALNDDDDDGNQVARVQTETQSSNNPHEQNPTSQLMISFFYGLSVLVLGVTGLLLAITIVPEQCNDYDDGDYDAFQKSFIRKQAALNIAIAIIPMILASVHLWCKKLVPSTGVTLYFAIILLGSAIIVIFDPNWDSELAKDIHKWWITLTSFTWMLLLSYRYIISNEKVIRNSYSWGINIGALTFFGIMFVMVEIDNDTIWNWLLLNVLSFIPLILLGLIIEHNFVLFLGVFGLLLDIWYLAEGLSAILHFAIFAVGGVGLLALGSRLKKNQDLIREPCLRLILGGDERLITGYQNANENGFENIDFTSDSTFCCSDSQEVFAWVGAFIVNIAFISIISVSMETNILIGFFLTSIYTGILYQMAQYFGDKNDEIEMDGSGTTEGNEIPVPIVQGILYGLSILALGTSGVLLALAINSRLECQEDQGCVRRNALLIIFLSTVPMITASMYLWIKKFVPSGGLMTYLGIVFFGAALTIAIDPHSSNDIFANTFYKLWILVSSLIWTLTLVYHSLRLVLSRDETKKTSLSWGINVGALAYFCIMFVMVEIDNDTIWNWITVNLFSFIPLILLGIISDHNFIVFLGVLGLYIDIVRLTSGLEIILRYICLGISGIGVIALGSWLKSKQDVIRAPFDGRRRISSSAIASEALAATDETTNEEIV